MHFKATLLLFSALASVGDCTRREGEQVIDALSRLGPAATSFCSSFLGIPKKTITVATVTPIVTVTTTTTTFTTIRVDKRAAATLAARACPVFGLPCDGLERRVNHPVPANLLPFSGALVSIACSLLHITPAVTSVTATLPPITTKTTIITTATSTVKRGNCDADAAHNASGNGSGNTVTFISQSTTLACCLACQTSPNCVANAFVAGQCQLLTKISAASGALTTAMCPLGVESYNFGPLNPGGLVFKGPCGL